MLLTLLAPGFWVLVINKLLFDLETLCVFSEIYIDFTRKKNAGHNMAILGEPCNTDAHAQIPALFMSMLCPRLRNMSSTV